MQKENSPEKQPSGGNEFEGNNTEHLSDSIKNAHASGDGSLNRSDESLSSPEGGNTIQENEKLKEEAQKY